MVTSETKTKAKEIRKKLKSDISVEQIMKSQKNNVISEGIYELSDKELPKKLKIKKGVSKIYKHNNQYVTVKIIEEVAPKQKTFDEVKGRVINDYQTQIEKDWLLNLASKYEVKVNDEVLESVKKSL